MARVVAPEEIVAEAREWEGTRWQHQAGLKGTGADCAGYTLGVGIHTGSFDVHPYTPEMRRRFGGYGKTPNPALMAKALEELMVRIRRYEDAVPGDVAYLRFDETAREVTPQHLVIITGGGWRVGGTMIHALRWPSRKIVEHSIDRQWFDRIHKVYRYPAVDRHIRGEVA